MSIALKSATARLCVALACLVTAAQGTAQAAILEAEPNNSAAQAAPLSPGVTVSGQLSRAPDETTQDAGDADWFRVSATAAGTINVTFDYATTCQACTMLSHWMVSVLDGTGNVLVTKPFPYATNPPGVPFSVAIGSAGQYYVSVTPGTSFDYSHYTLTVTGDTLIVPTSVSSPTVGALGTPAAGSVVSGVGVISGYHCTSKDIEVFIDGISIGKAGAGTRLLGTQDVCGRTDTGFSLLYAFNNLSNGSHVFSVFADGVLFDTHTATTFQSGGQPWLSGFTGSFWLNNFPVANQMAKLEWVESYQNFLVTEIQCAYGGTYPSGCWALVP